MQRLSSAERLLRTIRGEPVDRIPILSPLDWTPMAREIEPGSWRDEPNYRGLVPLVAENCDFLVDLVVPEGSAAAERIEGQGGYETIAGGIFDRRFFLIPPEQVEVAEEETRDGQRSVAYLVHTPKGDLREVDEFPTDIDTTWASEPLIKEPEDVKRILSVPYRFDRPNLDAFFARREQLGDRGLAQIFVSSCITHISRMTGLQQFLEWVVTERPLIDRMLEEIYPRVQERLRYVLDHGAGPVFHFGGSEQATPPLMSNRLFDELVVKYDAPLMKMVRDAGKIVHVHCHGRVNTVLDRFIEMGVQFLDPVEPPPQGDTDLAEAKRRAAGRMTLIGNIEMVDLETETPDVIEERVRDAVCLGGRGHFILSASDFTISRVSDRMRENIRCFVEAGIKYGPFDGSNPCPC